MESDLLINYLQKGSNFMLKVEIMPLWLQELCKIKDDENKQSIFEKPILFEHQKGTSKYLKV